MSSVVYLRPKGTPHRMNGETEQDRQRAIELMRGLFDSHDDLVSYLIRILKRREIAEEVAQESYLRIYCKYPPEKSVYTRRLLFSTARNQALSALRRSRLEQKVVDFNDVLDGIAEVPDELPRPDRQVASSQAIERLAEVLGELSENVRQVFVMRFFDRMQRQHIADRLGITVPAVEKRIGIALAYCRSRLAAMGINGLGGE